MSGTGRRARLRPAWPEEELRYLYAVPHRHTDYPDHFLRVEHTISLGKALLRQTGHGGATVVDLSCGDAAIPLALSDTPLLGDLAPGYPVTGPVEETIHSVPPSGLLVCSETIEHLDNPDMVLAAARDKALLLLLSTPLSEFDNHNPQHYWGWDADAVREMLNAAGWEPVIWSTVVMPAAAFQIWGCK